jgi:two-component system, cell cycle sensor histidine kinase and response regulator CckA
MRPAAAEQSAPRAPESWFELLAETTFDGVGLTQDEIVVEANERLASMLGYTREEIIGAPLMNFVAPAHQDLVREREATGDEDLYEHRAVRKDGSTLLVEARGRNCTYRGRPARLAVVRDVTKAALRESLKAEGVLRREKEQLDRAATAGRVALWEWDLATGDIEWTAFVDAMLGFAPGGVPRTAAGWASHVHPEDVDAVVAALDAHLRQGAPYDTSYRIRRADGEYAWWHDVGVAERDAAGKPFRMAGTCVDITERKKAEEAVRVRETALMASERRLEEAQRVARLGWYSYHPATDVFSVSSTADDLFGIPPGFRHDAAGWLSLVHPDDRDRVREVLEKSVAGVLTPDLLYRIVRPKDGEERHIHAHASAVFDVSGRVVRIFGTFQDETEQRRIESEIRRLAAAVEQVAQSVVITDTAGTIQYVNAAFTSMTGYDRDAAVGANPRLLRSGRHDAAHYENLWRTILSGATWRGRFTNRKRDGTLYEADAVITPVRDGFGNLTSFVCLERDVTDVLAQQKRLQEQQTLAAIGEIAANIAHEVKNPLFAISSGIQLLMEELALDAEQRRTFEVIHGDVLRMDRLVRQLQLLASRRPLQPGPRAVAGLVEGAATLNRGLAVEKALRITTTFEEGLPDVFVDEDQIHQVLLNLIQNAISYSPPGGRVSISAARNPAGDRVVLRFHNEGPPIADGLAERIFEPFFSTRRESAGMGLAISRRIVLDHGGSLRAEPHPDAGVVFALELPMRSCP